MLKNASFSNLRIAVNAYLLVFLPLNVRVATASSLNVIVEI